MTKTRTTRKGSTGSKAKAPPREAAARKGDDWREEMLTRIRAVMKKADPDAVEERKWGGVPVWSHDGIICTGETYKSVVKMTFAQGASLDDPARLFNSSLEGNTRRAIDFREGDRIDEKALATLIRAAVALNTARTAAKKAPKKKEPARRSTSG